MRESALSVHPQAPANDTMAPVTALIDKLLATVGLNAEEIPSREGWKRLLALLSERLAGDDVFWTAIDASESANRLKTEFLGVMSHELRTPLNGMLGMAQLLRDTELDEERRDWVETILTSGDSLLTVVNAILDFSKLEAGSLALVDGITGPRTLAFDTMQLFAATAHQKGLRLCTVVESDVPDTAGGDDRRIRQVLANIVGNAIKFTDEGHIVLHVRTVHAENQHSLCFDITDTGIGIEPEVHGHIFDSFVQVDASETRRFGGTGLGLAIAKRLANLMRGEISFVSTFGSGSTFSFEVPLRSYDEDEARAPAHSSLRVLLIEGVETVAAAHRTLLTQLGLSVHTAQTLDGAKAALAATPNAFDLLLLDGSGNIDAAVELCEALATVPSSPPAFVLAPSGHSAPATRTDRAKIAVIVHGPLRPEHLPRIELAADGVRSTLGQMIASSKEPLGARKRRALVVEDNAINQRVAVRTLERLGLEAEAVGNGRDALVRLSQDSFDVVFMDCQLPIMNGFEATRRFRQTEPEGRHTPVIAMTAQAMPGDRERCIGAGMDDYVSKPLRLGDLEQKLVQWVSNG